MILLSKVRKLLLEILQKPKKKSSFPQIKSNQEIISCYEEQCKRLTCKIITSVHL